MSSNTLEQNFKMFLQAVDNCKKKINANNIKLVAVSKTYSAENILQLAQLGQSDFAENYLQEAIDKINTINNLNTTNKQNKNIIWHYIGNIQSNKTKLIANNFSWVHSVDRIKIAEKLNYYRSVDYPKLNILLQIKLEEDPSKSGLSIKNIDLIETTAVTISKMPNINLRGLMCILKLDNKNFGQQVATFELLKKLKHDLNQKYHELCLDTLSMGMSNDFEAAIAAGSNMIRIGSAIFGNRR